MITPRKTLRTFAATFLLMACCTCAAAQQPIRVRHAMGTARGFLIMHGEDGKVLAHGDLIQTAVGDRVTTRLVFHFLDSSVDDESTTYTQRGTLHMVTDHHIQKGPFFPKPIDVLVDAATGQVTTRSIDKDGHEKVDVDHKDLPPDTYNGMVGTVLLNTPRDTAAFKIALLAPTGKGRLVKLAITRDQPGTFYAVGLPRRAQIFRIKVELGGVAGVVAPVIGKQPADTLVWIFEGEAPALIREVGQLYEGSPIVSIEVSGSSFPDHAHAASH